MEDYDDAKRSGSGMPARAPKKERVTMYLDPRILDAFRSQAARRGAGYQTLINEALRHTIHPDAAPVTIDTLRRVLREEFDRHCSTPRPGDGQ